MLHFRSVYVSLLFYFSSVCLLLANFSWVLLFLFLFLCLPLSIVSSTLTNYPSPVLWYGRASIPSRMSFLSKKIVPWAVFPVFVRFVIILVWSFISSSSSKFSLCSAIINASSTSSSLKVPFPSPVILCFSFFLFACELFWRGWPLATSRLDYLYYILVELSSFAVGFHELMDSKNVNHLLADCSQWPHIHFCYISIRYLIGPTCRDSVLRSSMQRTLLIFRLKGFIRIFVSGSHTSVIVHMLLRLFSL